MRRGQSGLSIAMVIVTLGILVTVMLAAMSFSRISSNTQENDDAKNRVARLVDALDRFAAENKRLPCPADPTIETGIEGLTAPNAATCTNAAQEGWVPWKTLGLKREDAYDAWGIKISYRVYTGNKGSLVQPRGIDMTECDTVEPTTGNTTPTVGSAGGLCVSNANPLLRSTRADKFLQGKGLTLKEKDNSGTVLRTFSDVAYVVFSHGQTMLGGYTASGIRREMPKGDELDNTKDAGDFTLRPFSGVDVAADANTHFDDIVAYRTLPDLVKKAGLAARDWEDEVVGTSLLNSAAVALAPEAPPSTTGVLGANQLTLGAVTVTGSSGASLTQETTSLVDANGNPIEGFGVEGGAVLGFFGNQLGSATGEFLRFGFVSNATKFAIALTQFGTYVSPFDSVTYTERTELRFLDANGNTVATQTVTGCRAENSLTSFSVNAGVPFRSVEVRPLFATPFNSNPFSGGYPTLLLVSEVTACVPTAPTCTTTLSNPCP